MGRLGLCLHENLLISGLYAHLGGDFSCIIARCTYLTTPNPVSVTPTPSPASARCLASGACLMTRRRGWSHWYGAQKNDLRRLWPCPERLVRPQTSTGTGSVLWRHPRLSTVRGSAHRLHAVRQGEDRDGSVSGEQPVLHRTVRLVRGRALPERVDPVGREGTSTGLADGEGAGDGLHACAVGACGAGDAACDRC